MSDIAAVRKRPAMYVGDTSTYGLTHCLYEVVSNSIDEFLGGRCRRIDIDLTADGGFTVTDDGGGIRPTVDIERALTTLHATPAVETDRPHRHVNSGAGLGLAVVGALAERLEIASVHESRSTNITICRGVVIARTGTPIARGTQVRFVPDHEIFAPVRIPFQSVERVMRGTCAVLRDLEVSMHDAPITLNGREGLLGLLNPRGHLGPPFVYRNTHDGTLIDVAAEWSPFTPVTEEIQSFANLQPTPQHGTHVDGFRRAVTAAVGRWRGLAGLRLVISIDRESITYSGPTRGQLGTPEIVAIVKKALVGPLRDYFDGAGREVRRFLSSRARNVDRARRRVARPARLR